MNAQMIIDEIREKVGGRNQYVVAAELKISPAYLSRLLSGRRPLTDAIAREMGYERVVVYEPIRDASDSAGAEQ